MDREYIRWMTHALELAERAYGEGEVPVGAVVVRRNVIIGRGRNRVVAHGDPTAHAEILALRDAAREIARPRLEGCTLYTTLEPCPMCAGAAVVSRIEHLVFGAHDEKWGAAVTLYSIPHDSRLNHRCSIVGGVMDGASLELLQRFFADRRYLPHYRDDMKHGRA